jgi:putative membrane protein
VGRLVIHIAISWAVNVAALFVADAIFSDVTRDDWQGLVIAGLVFGLVNTFVKPVVKLLSLPFILLTLGVLLFFINMAMLALTDWIVSGFDIEGFWTYVGATIVVWLVNAVFENLSGVD